MLNIIKIIMIIVTRYKKGGKKMLELFIFCEVIICTLLLIGFIVSLGNCIKNGKFDFVEMFKSFLIFLGIAFFSLAPRYIIFKVFDTFPVKSVSYKDDKKIKKLNTYRKKQGKEILLVEKNQIDAYLEYLKKNKLDKKALK